MLFLRASYDNKLAAYAGIYRALERAMGNYYRKGIYADVIRFVHTCHTSQLTKADRSMHQGEGRALPVDPYLKLLGILCISTGSRIFRKRRTALIPSWFSFVLIQEWFLQTRREADTCRNTAQHFVHNVIRLHGMP